MKTHINFLQILRIRQFWTKSLGPFHVAFSEFLLYGQHCKGGVYAFLSWISCNVCHDYHCFINRLEYTRQDTSDKQETLSDGSSPELQVKLLHKIHQTMWLQKNYH